MLSCVLRFNGDEDETETETAPEQPRARAQSSPAKMPTAAATATTATAAEEGKERKEDKEEKEAESTASVSPSRRVLRDKVVAVAKLCHTFKMLRENSEALMRLKQLTPNRDIPLGLINEGPEAIQKAISDFDHVLVADEENEHRPFEEGERPAVDSTDPRRNSIKHRSKRSSLPSHINTGFNQRTRRKRHMRNVKSEDWSGKWSRPSTKEPCFTVTPVIFEEQEDRAAAAKKRSQSDVGVGSEAAEETTIIDSELIHASFV